MNDHKGMGVREGRGMKRGFGVEKGKGGSTKVAAVKVRKRFEKAGRCAKCVCN